jgi:acylphosphatase
VIYRFVISGMVQGVGFRWFVARRARDIGVSGYVRNLPDGSVEAVARCQDDVTLAQLESLLQSGPAHARVDRVEREPLPEECPVPVRSFDIR